MSNIELVGSILDDVSGPCPAHEFWYDRIESGCPNTVFGLPGSDRTALLCD